MSEPSPLESIFFAALEKAPGERAAYLAEACAGDASLRQRVEKMLAAQVDAESFLESPPAGIAVPADHTIDQHVAEKVGTQIGPYKLIEQIGEGGMGTVWMAQQSEPVRRLVAVKLIKAGMDSRQVIARFEAERQALALMDHPNIARVLDGGTTSGGRPYFVMDLVRGVPITRYCDEHHLTPRQRLELFIPVCQAIQHAHHKGIIHRDLKPSNVLVALYDGKPVPKVIDFGVAKAAGQPLTEKTLITGFGNIVGTLEYMSPEQATFNQLDIDTRSDIYSLGVLLYELLTGCTPFDGKRLRAAAFDEMLRIIREEEPPKPSTRLSSTDTLPSIAANRSVEPARLGRVLRGELDWIVMKALEKDRNRRYETANGLAMDVQRYLSDEQVLACPPSAAYRLRKFAWRNRQALASAVFVGLMLLVAAAGALVYAAKQRALANERAEFSVEQGNSLRKLEGIQRQTQADLYQALLRQSAALREGRQPGYRTQVWANLRQAAALPASDPDDIRRELLACLGDPIGLEPSRAEAARRAETAAIPELFRRLVPKEPKFSAVAPDESLLAVYKGRVILHGKDGNVVSSADQVLGGIYDLEFTSDGRFLVAGCEEGVVVWTVPDLRPFTFYRGHNTFFVAVQPDGPLIASTGTAITLWSLRSNRLVATLKSPPAMESVEFSSNGKLLLATGLEAQVLAAWRVCDTPEKLELAGHDGAVPTVAYSPDGALVASAGKDRKVKVWGAQSGVLRFTAEGHTGTIESVAFSPDGTLLASADNHAVIRFWDPTTGEALGKFAAPCGQVWRLQFDPGGRYLAAAGGKGISAWEIQRANDRLTAEEFLSLPTATAAYDLAVHPGGTGLVWLELSGNLFAWDLIQAVKRPLPGRPLLLLRTLHFDPGGNYVRFTTIDRQLGAVGWLQGAAAEVPKNLKVEMLASSPDGQFLATTDPSMRRLVVYDAESGREWAVLPPQGAEMWALSWSPDGTRLAAGLTDGGVVIWDLNQVRARLAEFQIDVPTTARSTSAPQAVALSEEDFQKIVKFRGVDLALRDEMFRVREASATLLRAEAVMREKRVLDLQDTHKVRLQEADKQVQEKTEVLAERTARLDSQQSETVLAATDLVLSYNNRGYLQLEAGHFRRAVANFDEATKLGLGSDWREPPFWSMAAAVYLYVGDVDRYRGACEWMLDHLERSKVPHPGVCLQVARTCSLMPDSISDFSRAERMVDRGFAATEIDPGDRMVILTKGLTEYRAGRYQQAVDYLNRFAPKVKGEIHDCIGFAALSMAHHRLGDHERARLLLRSAHDIIAPPHIMGRLSAVDGIHCEIWCREADGLVTGITVPPPDEGSHKSRHHFARAQVYELLEEWSYAQLETMRAIDCDPRNGAAWLLRARGHQRLGGVEHAIAFTVAAFELTMGVSVEEEGCDWFLLAMAHWQLGEKDMARDLYNHAVKWMEENQPDNEELRRLDAEAKKLMQEDAGDKDQQESQKDPDLNPAP